MYPDPFVVHFRSFLPARARRVLDAGCGAGRNAQYLQQQGLSVFALDLSPGMVRRTAAIAGQAMVAAVDRLPLATGGMNAAVCTSVLEYADALTAAAAVAELRRVVAPGGLLLLEVAALEGSDGEYPTTTPAVEGSHARLTSEGELRSWLDGCRMVELLHVVLKEPPSPPVRAQWVCIAQQSA